MNGIAADDEAGVFRALADSTRRQILEELRSGELSAGEIAARFPISGPSISRHLGVLKVAGLIRERRVANRIFYSPVEERLALCVSRFLSTVCPEQFVFRLRSRGTVEKENGT
jgi:DNA-binding transcriptional ArsR family regulator